MLDSKESPKMAFLKKLKSESKKENGDKFEQKLGHMKKVVVEAPTEDGLEKGLDKAEEILKRRKSLLGLPDSLPEEESSLPPSSEESSESLEESPDSLGEPELESDLTEKYDLLKDLSSEDMLKVVQFLQTMIANKE